MIMMANKFRPLALGTFDSIGFDWIRRLRSSERGQSTGWRASSSIRLMAAAVAYYPARRLLAMAAWPADGDDVAKRAAAMVGGEN